jgi:hypothetical protein
MADSTPDWTDGCASGISRYALLERRVVTRLTRCRDLRKLKVFLRFSPLSVAGDPERLRISCWASRSLDACKDLVGDLLGRKPNRRDGFAKRTVMMESTAFRCALLLPDRVSLSHTFIATRLPLEDDLQRRNETELKHVSFELLDTSVNLVEVGEVRERHRHDDRASKPRRQANPHDSEVSPQGEVLKVLDGPSGQLSRPLQDESDQFRIEDYRAWQTSRDQTGNRRLSNSKGAIQKNHHFRDRCILSRKGTLAAESKGHGVDMITP